MGNRKPNSRKPKLEIVFDAKKRVEFLTGFRKRKNERRKRAQQQFEQLLKLEKKRISDEVKSGFERLKRSYAPIPELEEILREEEEDYEHDQVEVKVVSLTPYSVEENTTEKDSEGGEAENGEEDSTDELPGMSLKVKPVKTKPKEIETPTLEKPLHNKKELNRLKKEKANKCITKSRLFKMKTKIERIQNKKKSRQLRSKKRRELKKHKGKSPKLHKKS